MHRGRARRRHSRLSSTLIGRDSLHESQWGGAGWRCRLRIKTDAPEGKKKACAVRASTSPSCLDKGGAVIMRTPLCFTHGFPTSMDGSERRCRRTARPRAAAPAEVEHTILHRRDLTVHDEHHALSTVTRPRPTSARGSKPDIHRVDPEFGSTLMLLYRDFQSKCWVNLRILGQPCEFYLLEGCGRRAAED
jgi:hypothetical protein